MIKIPRDYGWAVLLSVASLVLALVLLVQWIYLRGVREDVRQATAVTATEAKVDDAKTADDAAHALPGQEAYGEMTNRPLFMEGRRPASDAGGEEPVAAPEQRTPLNAKLMGVVLTPSGKTALLTDAQGKYKRVRKNSVIDGWKLVDIQENKVTMEQGGERKDLPLMKPKPKTAAATPQKPTGKATVSGPNQASDEDAEDTGAEDGTDAADESEDTSDEESADEDTGSDEASDEQ